MADSPTSKMEASGAKDCSFAYFCSGYFFFGPTMAETQLFSAGCYGKGAKQLIFPVFFLHNFFLLENLIFGYIQLIQKVLFSFFYPSGVSTSLTTQTDT